MKYIKILGLLAVAAAAMMAFAASASATTVTGPTTDTEGKETSQSQIETPTIHAVNEVTETQKHVTLHNGIVNIECQSTVTGTVTTHGPTETTSGPISVLNFNNCTNEWVIDVKEMGSLEIHYVKPTDGNPHGWGTLTSNGATVTATRAGLSCSYRTVNKDIGTVTGGNPATLHIEATIERHGGSFLCGGSTAQWTGSYVTTHTLAIDP